MRKVLLDTSFMLSCVRQKIDFFEELPLEGMQILIPIQVISELRGILRSDQKREDIDNAALTIKIVDKASFEKINLGTANVDQGIIDYADKNKNVIIATLDREIKKAVKNMKMVIRRKKKLEVI